MTGVAIRCMESRDVPAIVKIQSHCKEAAQWSLATYEEYCAVENPSAWVTECGERILGFLIARRVSEDFEILNLAVDPSSRRQGIGRALLRQAIREAAENDANKIFLEVRASNHVALLFYEAHGFSPSGKRKDYYRNPTEDALLLTCALSPATAQSIN